MMAEHPPATLEGLKRHAKRLKREQAPHLSHARALNLVARHFGFANYSEAHSHYTKAIESDEINSTIDGYKADRDSYEEFR